MPWRFQGKEAGIESNKEADEEADKEAGGGGRKTRELLNKSSRSALQVKPG
jgi:hypothetical protein